MSVRDISPLAWSSPGTARQTVGLVLSNLSDQALPFDVLLSIYAAPRSDASVNLTSGVNTIAVPDTTNQRGLWIFPPINNQLSFNVKWDNGDTGGFIHPNGAYFTTFDPDNMPANLYITVGGNMNGCSLYWW